MIVNIMQDEYVPTVGEAAGARVLIHSPDEMPFPEDAGFLLKPGTFSSIAVTKVINNLRHNLKKHSEYLFGYSK